MNTLTIDKLLINQPKFKGAFPCDMLPKVQDNEYSMIVNTDNSFKQGEHWTAFVIVNDNVYYMDSFGRNYDNKSFPNDYTSNLAKLFLGKRVRINNKVLQGFQNNTCADYCVYFIAKFYENIPFPSIFKDFTEDFNFNDKKIVKYIFKL